MGVTSIALTPERADGKPLAYRSDREPGQAERIIPLIDEVMTEAGLAFGAIDRIAVGTGPGTFSGIRTGVAAARGIGLAARIEVVGATSFQIMAAAFEDKGRTPSRYGIAAFAGTNAVYCQVFGAGCKPLTPISSLAQDEAAVFFGDIEILTGPGAAALVELGYVDCPRSACNPRPDAATLAQLAPLLDPDRDKPTPYYVRAADARPQTGHVLPRKNDG